MDRATVTSRDGTAIGYRRMGSGPGLVLVHGGMMASQNFVELGDALAERFTVAIPDRRGRGASGPFGADYGIARDVEDMQAVSADIAARDIFGLSSGAIIALQTALDTSTIERVAAYEPPLSVCGFDYAHWVGRFDREIEAGNLAAAMVTVMRGTSDSRALRLVPRAVLEPVFGYAIRDEAKRARPGDVPIAELIPTMHYDARIVTEVSATSDRFRAMCASVLLLGGSKTARFLGPPLSALAKILPHSSRIEIPGVGHLAAANGRKPKLVAAELCQFFRA